MDFIPDICFVRVCARFVFFPAMVASPPLQPSLPQKPRAHQHEQHTPDAGPNRCGAGQPTLVRIVACLLVLDDILELGLHQLPVEVGDLIVERILEALQAFALVAAGLEATAKDGHALQIVVNGILCYLLVDT